MANGKMISLETANQISEKYDEIRSDFSTKVFAAVSASRAESDTKRYYGDEVKAFVFDLALIRTYLTNTPDADTLLVIKAADVERQNIPTTIIAAAKANGNVYTVMADENGEVPEHPGESGKVSFGANGNKKAVFTFTSK